MDQEEYKGYTIKIEPDDNPQDPREWDNLGKMICFHKRYELGDKHNYSVDSFDGWEDLKKQLVKDGAVVIAPLFLYDHSGLRIKIGSFAGLLPQGHAEFDSGQVGFIVAFAEDVKKKYGVKRITKEVKAKVQKLLEGEVKILDQAYSGDVWGYIVEKDGEEVDSCWGFYGYDEAVAEAKGIVDWEVKDGEKKREEKTKKYIQGKVPLIYRA